ncbi:MAG: hypothetical protein U9O78_00360 [Patescibacteria group bacterium]|nr:hypothetical protein [Patescibacteria group bacterium]
MSNPIQKNNEDVNQINPVKPKISLRNLNKKWILFTILVALAVLVSLIFLIGGFLIGGKNPLQIVKDSSFVTSIVKRLPFVSTSDKQKKAKDSDEAIETAESPVKREYEEIADNLMLWLDEQKDDNGSYANQIICEPSCDRILSAGTSGHDGVPVVWGRYKYYEKNQTKEALAKLTNDLKIYANKELVPSIQANGWTCNLMHDLWKSKVLPKKQRDLASDICWRTTYYAPEEMGDHITTGYSFGSTYEKVKKGLGKIEIQQIKDSKPEMEEVGQAVLNYLTTYPSDFVARYLWKNNDVDLFKAQYYFREALRHYSSGNDEFGDLQMCQLGVSSVDLYLLTDEKQYYDFGKVLAEESSGYFYLPCLFLYDRLAKLAPEVEINDETNKIGRHFAYYRDYGLDKKVAWTYDWEGYYPLTEEGGFLDTSANGGPKSVKSLRNNGLIIGLILSY